MVVFDDELPGFVGEPLCVMVSFTYAMCRQAVAPVPTTISTTLTAGLEVLSSQKKKRKLHKCCEEAGLTIFYDAGPAPAAKCMDFIWHVFSRNTLRTEPWEVAPLRSTTGTSTSSLPQEVFHKQIIFQRPKSEAPVVIFQCSKTVWRNKTRNLQTI